VTPEAAAGTRWLQEKKREGLTIECPYGGTVLRSACIKRLIEIKTFTNGRNKIKRGDARDHNVLCSQCHHLLGEGPTQKGE
jgi:hypothetical protein